MTNFERRIKTPKSSDKFSRKSEKRRKESLNIQNNTRKGKRKEMIIVTQKGELKVNLH